MIKTRRHILLSGALLAALSVILGAFGAHGLRLLLTPTEMDWWQTGVQYQMWHALGLAAIAGIPAPRLGLPASLIGIGTLIFSISLYVLTFTHWHWIGFVTPIGGLMMIAGWVVLAWRARSLVIVRDERDRDPH